MGNKPPNIINGATDGQPLRYRILASKLSATPEPLVALEHHEVAFFFLGSAVRRNLIHSPTIEPLALLDYEVYARTADAVYATQFRSIREVVEHMPEHFLRANSGMLLNQKYARWLEAHYKQKRAGIRLLPTDKTASDWIVLTDAAVREFRRSCF